MAETSLNKRMVTSHTQVKVAPAWRREGILVLVLWLLVLSYCVRSCSLSPDIRKHRVVLPVCVPRDIERIELGGCGVGLRPKLGATG